jgi:hypothetical protein
VAGGSRVRLAAGHSAAITRTGTCSWIGLLELAARNDAKIKDGRTSWFTSASEPETPDVEYEPFRPPAAAR